MALGPKDLNRDGAADKRLDAVEKHIDDLILRGAPGGTIMVEKHWWWSPDLADELKRRYEAAGWRVCDDGISWTHLMPPTTK